MAKDNARRLLVRQSIVEKFRMDCKLADWSVLLARRDLPCLDCVLGFGLDFCAVAPVLGGFRLAIDRVRLAAARDVSPFLGRRCFGLDR